MQFLDPLRLAKLAESLAIAFYVLMGLAFLATVFGSPGTGFLLLILGACAHVARVWSEDLGRAQTVRRPPSARQAHAGQPRRRPT
jgi:hypothetical protein